jgi:hypothetical protein
VPDADAPTKPKAKTPKFGAVCQKTVGPMASLSANELLCAEHAPFQEARAEGWMGERRARFRPSREVALRRAGGAERRDSVFDAARRALKDSDIFLGRRSASPEQTEEPPAEGEAEAEPSPEPAPADPAPAASSEGETGET